VTPAHFGDVMPNSSCALTATKPGIGEHHPAFIHTCARPHSATNLGTRATLHDYHLEGEEVNADSRRIRGEVRWPRNIAQSLCYDSASPALLLRAERSDRCAHQLLDTRLTIHIADRRGAGGAIAGQRLLLSAKFGIEVAARQLE